MFYSDARIAELVAIYAQFYSQNLDNFASYFTKEQIMTLDDYREAFKDQEIPETVCTAQTLRRRVHQFLLRASKGVSRSKQIHTVANIKEIFSSQMRLPDPDLVDFLECSTFFITKQMADVIKIYSEFCIYLAANGTLGTNGSNILLSGVKGVGKTTLLKFLYYVTKKYFSEYLFPIFIDFNEAKLLPSSILEHNFLFKPGGNISEQVYLLSKSKKALVCFGDEMDRLYKDNAPPEDLSVKIVQELYTIGKSTNCLGIISGSSATTAALAFKETCNGKPVNTYHSYPNLNHTVYQDCRLFPLRSRQDLEAFVKENSQNININELFYYSGGILRKIATYLRTSCKDRPSESTKQKLLTNLLRDPHLASIFLMLSRKSDNQRNYLNYPPQIPAQIDKHVKLYEWIEKALIFKTMEGALEFLYPWHADFLQQEMPNTKMTINVLLSFSILIHRLPGGDPGTCAEEYVVKHLVPARIGLQYFGKFNGKQFFPAGSGSHLIPANAIIWLTGDEIGINFFTCQFTAENSITVTAGQIKCGGSKSTFNKASVRKIVKRFKQGKPKLLEQLSKTGAVITFSPKFYVFAMKDFPADLPDFSIQLECVNFSDQLPRLLHTLRSAKY